MREEAGVIEPAKKMPRLTNGHTGDRVDTVMDGEDVFA